MASKEWRNGLSHALSSISDATCAVGNLEDAAPDEHADDIGEAIARASMALSNAQRVLREADALIRSAGGAS